MGFNLLEPEETVGQLWHRLITHGLEAPHYPEAVVELRSLERRLSTFFHGLGGDKGTEIKPIGVQQSAERRSWRERIAHMGKEVQQARLDGDTLYLPLKLDLLPTRYLNRGLYFWLAAYCAAAGGDRPPRSPDPLRDDLAALHFAHRLTRRTLRLFPGTKPLFEDLATALLDRRPPRALPAREQEIETIIRQLLGAESERVETSALFFRVTGEKRLDFSTLPTAPDSYHPFKPVPLWGQIIAAPERISVARRDPDDEEGERLPDGREETESERSVRASRKESDLAERRDSLLLYPFSGIVGWLEKLNINRHVEDEDDDAASKAMEEADDIELGDISKKPASKLKFDLDLAPADVARERLSGKATYPEWDYRRKAYLPDHCRVLMKPADTLPDGADWEPEPETRRRIQSVRRRFEALRPKREMLHRQLDGSEFDMDALVRSRCELAASGQGSNNIYLLTRQHGRDLAVAVLMDTSRSTESWIEGRQVIEIAKESLAALSLGLRASGDDHAIYGFSSVRRDRIYLSTIKSFDEHVGPKVMSRIGALKPGYYTRLGAAIRHTAKRLEERANAHRLLLIITDGKPNDLDHYEGRYGVEDTRLAVSETRRSGLAVFGVTIDAKAQSYFPYMFGKGGYAIVSHPDRLTKALPALFQHLIA